VLDVGTDSHLMAELVFTSL